MDNFLILSFAIYGFIVGFFYPLFKALHNRYLVKKYGIVEKARQYAIKCHTAVNHKYDGKPYHKAHLQKVVDVAKKFSYLVPPEKWDIIIGSAYAHDLQEDTMQTFSDIKKATNEEIAEIVYALTNEKGRNRAERANDKYYQGIRDTPYADYVKLCDRIANVQASKDKMFVWRYSKRQKGVKMFEQYKKENANFEQKIYNPKYEEMFEYLRQMFKKT